ncbi:MAG: hypothetical protein F6K36_26565 [Symploca sp. SIO3C6]|nr:hypothetical protein [Symploca sp. SIO3C6]
MVLLHWCESIYEGSVSPPKEATGLHRLPWCRARALSEVVCWLSVFLAVERQCTQQCTPLIALKLGDASRRYRSEFKILN